MLSRLVRAVRHAPDDEVTLDATKEDGTVEQQRVPIRETAIYWHERQLVAVSDNIAALVCVTTVTFEYNAFTAIPAGVLVMTQLTSLLMPRNRLLAIPPEIGRLTKLKSLHLHYNQIAGVPREIGQLAALEELALSQNRLSSVPSELAQLQALKMLHLSFNQLCWLPGSLHRLPMSTKVVLNGNPLPVSVGHNERPSVDSRAQLPAIFAATVWHALADVRELAITVCVGLADLELPALVVLEILDAAFPNTIPMHKKWDLVTAVKHFHQRRGIVNE